MSLRRLYVLEKIEERHLINGTPTELVKRYRRIPWGDAKAGDSVVLVEPDGVPLDNGADMIMVGDPWVDPDMGIHVVKVLEPVQVNHAEEPRGKMADKAGKEVLRGAVETSLPAGPGPVDRRDA